MESKRKINVKGTTILDIDITPDELLKSIINYFHLGYIFYPSLDVYYEIENINGCEVLSKYEDISYHGTSCYKKVEEEYDLEMIELYKHIKYLKDLIEK